MRTAQNKKRLRAKIEEQKVKNAALVVKAHQDYIDVAKNYLTKANHVLNVIETTGLSDIRDGLLIESIRNFINHGTRQISQIERRIIFGEIIPHHEKVFSIFQTHTEWVMKVKQGCLLN